MEDVLKHRLHYLILISALLISPFTASAQTQESFELMDVSSKKSETQIEVILELSNKINFESFTLFNPNRLILDLYGVKNFSNNPLIHVNNMGIESLRTVKNQLDVTRFIIDFDDKILQYSISQSGNNISIVLKREEEPSPEKKEEIIQEIKPSIEAPATKAIERQNVKQPAKEKPAKEQSEKKKARQKKKEQRKAEKSKSIKSENHSIALGLDGGLFYLQSQSFKDVYGNYALYSGVELDYFFHLNQNESIGLALSFNYITDKGKMTLTQEDVDLTLLPLSFSIVYQRNIGKFKPYVALGTDYFKYQETLPESFPVQKITGFLWGYNFQLGTHFKLGKFLSLKAFFKYHSAKKTENESLIDLSGLQLGLGILYIF